MNQSVIGVRIDKGFRGLGRAIAIRFEALQHSVTEIRTACFLGSGFGFSCYSESFVAFIPEVFA